jgi:hypothetical protein
MNDLLRQRGKRLELGTLVGYFAVLGCGSVINDGVTGGNADAATSSGGAGGSGGQVAGGNAGTGGFAFVIREAGTATAGDACHEGPWELGLPAEDGGVCTWDIPDGVTDPQTVNLSYGSSNERIVFGWLPSCSAPTAYPEPYTWSYLWSDAGVPTAIIACSGTCQLAQSDAGTFFLTQNCYDTWEGL